MKQMDGQTHEACNRKINCHNEADEMLLSLLNSRSEHKKLIPVQCTIWPVQASHTSHMTN